MKPPLLITVGPQCCGKTTFLAQLNNVRDISLDNQPGTYNKIEVSMIEYLFSNLIEGNIPKVIEENREMMYIMLLFREKQSLADVLQILTTLYIQEPSSQELLIEVLSEVFNEGNRFVSYNNVFAY